MPKEKNCAKHLRHPYQWTVNERKVVNLKVHVTEMTEQMRDNVQYKINELLRDSMRIVRNNSHLHPY